MLKTIQQSLQFYSVLFHHYIFGYLHTEYQVKFIFVVTHSSNLKPP